MYMYVDPQDGDEEQLICMKAVLYHFEMLQKTSPHKVLELSMCYINMLEHPSKLFKWCQLNCMYPFTLSSHTKVSRRRNRNGKESGPLACNGHAHHSEIFCRLLGLTSQSLLAIETPQLESQMVNLSC